MNAHPQQALAHAIRFLSIDAIVKAQEGHQGVPLGMAEIATALYTRHLKFNPQDAGWFDRDRVVLSNGHGSMLLYALLHLTGYPEFPKQALQSFRVLGSVCEGHPERPHGLGHTSANGIEVTTGPLGQGIANAFGMAVAEAYLNARFGDHLVLLWDDNQITDDGSTELSISENVAERFRVAGWHVVELDGQRHGGAHGAAGEVCVQPRLDWHWPQWAHAPAGRNFGVAACHAQYVGHAACRCGGGRGTTPAGGLRAYFLPSPKRAALARAARRAHRVAARRIRL